MNMSDEHNIFCLRCLNVKPLSEASMVFKTGYRRIRGVDFHLGVCLEHGDGGGGVTEKRTSCPMDDSVPADAQQSTC